MSYLFDELSGKESDTPDIQDKILMMGLQEAGKTAIKDVVFFDKQPGDVDNYMATVHYQRQFIDEEKKSLIIDSGGQESYWNEAVTQFRHLVFSNVKLLFWVVDVTKPELFEESERRFSFTIRQFKKENPDGNITVLCHKVDLVTPEKMVVIHQHIREMFHDKRFEIEFENTSIYYPDSLKDLVFTVMKEAGIDTRRFELISNIGQKVEESEEFQSYVMEHEEDPRIQQLREFLNPEPEPILPTFGKLDLEIDLTEYDIIELVLINKETYHPIVGASSQSTQNIKKSMDYLIGLHELKTKIKEMSEEISPTGTIIATSDKSVHGMIFNLASNYLLVTSFSEISEDKKKILYELIFKFAQSTTESAKKPVTEIPAAPIEEPVPVTQKPTVEIQTPSGETAQIDTTESIQVEETPVEVMESSDLEAEKATPIEAVKLTTETEEVVSATEVVPEVPAVAEETTASEIVKEEVVPESEDLPKKIIEPTAAPETVPVLSKDEEQSPVAALEEVIEEKAEQVKPEAIVPPEKISQKDVDPALKAEISSELSQILEEEKVPQPVPVGEEIQGVSEELMQETGTFVSGEREVSTPSGEAVDTKSTVDSKEIPAVESAKMPKAKPKIQVDVSQSKEKEVEKPIKIDFSADDIKGFANFLMDTKEAVPEGIFSEEAIKSMSDWLTSGISSSKEGTESKSEE